jgi:serine/threonine protein kinase
MNDTHPDLAQLAAFDRGQLDDDDAVAVACHVANCDSCQSALGTMPPDSLVSLVRAAGATPVPQGDGVAPAAPPGPRPEYEILGEVGRGGMGVVYKARQVGLDRIVALKRLRAGATADMEDLARFHREALAVARLQHPHIVQVHETGERDGLPFFVMEFVGGGSLTERLAEGPLPPRAAAELVETLSRAMHYAHRQGVVHRDLKPANVLLAPAFGGGKGTIPLPQLEAGASGGSKAAAPRPKAGANWVPKITDFGLAKHVDVSAGNTQTGTIVGTPSYMAPEQAVGRTEGVGPAADVYALGAILYECLTGRPPFKAASVLETVVQVRTQEPVPPGRLQPGLPRDLETICLKCLEKEPARRYATAAELADDLGRFLRREPIRARPAGAVERLHKWVRRQPAWAGLVAVSGLAVVALVAGILWHNARLRTEVQRAEAAERRAQANYQQARDTVSRMLERLDDRRWAQVPQLGELKKEQTEDALAFYKAIVRENDEQDPAVQFDVALAYLKAGVIEFALSRLDDSDRSLEQARLRFERLAGAEPDTLDYQRQLARCWNWLGHLHAVRRGPGDDPLHCYQEALAFLERLSGAHPEDRELRGNVTTVSHNVANALFAAGRLSEARNCREKTLARARELVREHPAVAEHQWDLAVALVNLGESHLADGQAPKAEAAFQEAEALLERSHREQPENQTLACNLAETYSDRVWVLLGTGRFPEAVELCTRALGLAEQYQRREPLARDINQILSDLFKERALAHGLAGDEAKASADWSRAAEAAEKSPDALGSLNGTLALAHLEDHERAAARVGPAGSADQLFPQALVYAACARAAGRDERLAAPDRDQRARHYVEEALTLLGQARAAGMLRNPAYVTLLRQGPSFATLRPLADFEKLLGELKEDPAG